MGATTYSVEIVVPEDADSERAGGTVEIEVAEDEYVLAAARNEGLWLPADCQLTKREIECLRWAAVGKTDKEIASIIDRSHAMTRSPNPCPM